MCPMCPWANRAHRAQRHNPMCPMCPMCPLGESGTCGRSCAPCAPHPLKGAGTGHMNRPCLKNSVIKKPTSKMDTDKNLKRAKANHDLARLRDYWRTASDDDAVRIVAAVTSINRRNSRTSSRAKLSGCLFGALMPIIDAGSDSGRNAVWLCSCSCGKRTAVSVTKLTARHTTSCGCRRAGAAKDNIAAANAGRRAA